MNPRGPPGIPTDIETFPQNNQIKSMERTPLQSLTYLYKIMRNRSGKIFFLFFSFFFKPLDFLENRPEFPLFFGLSQIYKNLRKHLKTLLIFQFSTSILGLLVHNPIKHTTQLSKIYTHIHLFTSIVKTFKTSSIPCTVL